MSDIELWCESMMVVRKTFSLFYCKLGVVMSKFQHILIFIIGGSFLLKMFTFYEEATICLLYVLCCAFSSVNVCKPATSKEGNSEVYVVCLEYVGKEVFQPWLDVLKQNFGKIFTFFIPSFAVRFPNCCSAFGEYKYIIDDKREEWWKIEYINSWKY